MNRRKENIAATDDLPLLHRLAIIYLMLPLAIWLLGWFEYWLGIPLTALIILALWNALSGSWRASVTPAALVLLLIALGWVMLNPAGGLFDNKYEDWSAHRTVLLELGRGGWPTFLIGGEYLYDDPLLLRYYLGYYMVPGLAGKWFGPAVLNWAVPLWTWGGVALVVLLFARRLTTLRATLATAVLIFFGGMKVLLYLLYPEVDTVESLLYLWTLRHLPNPVDTLVLYQSIALTFHNSPQHFITAGLASLLLLQLRHPRFLAVSGIVIATCPFWSSLLSIGLLPLVGVLILKNGIRPFLTWQNLLVAPVLTGLLALYLTSDPLSNDFSFLWKAYPTEYSQMLLDVFRLYLAEFLILAFLLYWMDRRIMREPFLIASLAVLLIAPWVHFLELSMRAIVPAQFVLAYYVARMVVGRLPEMTGRRHPRLSGRTQSSRTRAHRRATPRLRRRHLGVEAGHNPSRAVFALLLGVLSVGAISGLFVFALTESRPQALAYQRMFSTLMVSISSVAFPQKVARDIPNLLKTLLRDNDSDSKGELLLASKYDVYRTKNWLTYVNKRCDSQLERSIRLFLHIYPVVDKGAVPHYLKQPCHWSDKGDGNCIAMCQLPDRDIARIQTGQIIDDERPVWKADIEFKADGEPVISQVLDMTDFYVIEELNEPIYRAEYRNYVFDLYLHNHKLYYIRSRRNVTALLHPRTPAVGERFGVSLTPFGRQNTCTRQEIWQWERGSDIEGWIDISSPFGANGEHIIPTAAEVGYRLRARAECIDSDGNRHMAITDPSPPVTAQPSPKPHSDDSLFFLHVIPVDVGDLPDTAGERDFDNLDFRFSDYCIPYGEKLAVVRELPTYAIAGIRIGQYTDGGHHLWELNIRVGEK